MANMRPFMQQSKMQKKPEQRKRKQLKRQISLLKLRLTSVGKSWRQRQKRSNCVGKLKVKLKLFMQKWKLRHEVFKQC